MACKLISITDIKSVSNINQIFIILKKKKKQIILITVIDNHMEFLRI